MSRWQQEPSAVVIYRTGPKIQFITWSSRLDKDRLCNCVRSENTVSAPVSDGLCPANTHLARSGNPIVFNHESCCRDGERTNVRWCCLLRWLKGRNFASPHLYPDLSYFVCFYFRLSTLHVLKRWVSLYITSWVQQVAGGASGRCRGTSVGMLTGTVKGP